MTLLSIKLESTFRLNINIKSGRNCGDTEIFHIKMSVYYYHCCYLLFADISLIIVLTFITIVIDGSETFLKIGI